MHTHTKVEFNFANNSISFDVFTYRLDTITTRERQYADFIEIFKGLDPEIKLVCVCGNHDIGDMPTAETTKIYRDQFGQDFYSFRYGGVLFVILNSQYLKCPDAVPEETNKQQEFIDQLASTSPQPKHIGKCISNLRS